MKKKKPQRPTSSRPAAPPSRASLKARLLALVISPILFLVLAEVVLRLLGVGIPGPFWIKWTGSGPPVYVTNRHYCEHFVPKSLSREPTFSALHEPKPHDIRRVVVLGGSAAYGDPDPAFGFCRQLECLLNEHARGVTFKVINAAITSMNSLVACHIAHEAARHEPDLFIVFMGNNEVVGPYGPPTLPGALYASRTFINLSVAAKEDSRLGQLIALTAQRLHRGSGTPNKWLGMEAFLKHQIPANDPKLVSCYRHFRENLMDILHTAQDCGARVLICIPPVNLKDCPPFGSSHRTDLNKVDLARWEQQWQAGRKQERAGDWQGAWDHYQKAAVLDDRYAALRFCQGRCALQLGHDTQARAEFQAACDLDTLRFRADSSLQQTLTQVATQAGIRTLDLQHQLETLCPDHILGAEFLVDHVHLSPEGNFHAARWALERVREFLPGTLDANEESYDKAWTRMQHRLVYDPIERYKLVLTMYQRKTRPPFAGQVDHDREMATLRQDIVQLRQQSKRFTRDGNDLAHLADRYDNDIEVNKRYVQWLQEHRQGAAAVKRLQRMERRRPYDPVIRTQLAYTYAFLGARDQALEVLSRGRGTYRLSLQEVYGSVGTYCVEHGRINEAQWVFELLNKRVPNQIDTLINLASAASHRNDLTALKRYVDHALKIDPHSAQAMITMGNYYAKLKQPQVACTWFTRAVAAAPYDYLAHIGLGVQSLRVGKNQQGIQHIKQAVLLKPDFSEGYNLLATIYQAAGKPQLARQYAALRELFQP